MNHWSRECYFGCPGTAIFPCGLSRGWRWLMLMAQLLPVSDLTARLQEVAAHESRHVTVSRPEEVHCYSPLMPKWDSSVLQGLWHTHLTLSLSQCQITALPFLRHFILIISCSSSVMNHCFFWLEARQANSSSLAPDTLALHFLSFLARLWVHLLCFNVDMLSKSDTVNAGPRSI